MANKSTWSINALAKEFDMDRRTASTLLADVPPSGTKGGYAVYHLIDVAYLLSSYKQGGLSAGAVAGGAVHEGDIITAQNVDQVRDTKARKEWYEGERLRIAIATELGELVPAEAMRTCLADVFKRVKNFLAGTADVLERDVGLDPGQLEKIMTSTDKLCTDLYDVLVADPEESDDGDS